MKTFLNDRRHAKRYNIPLKLYYFDPITKCRGETLSKNISRSGLRFPINRYFPEGSLLDLSIEDPHSNRFISSKAKIIWAEKFISGNNTKDTIYEIGVKLLKRMLY